MLGGIPTSMSIKSAERTEQEEGVFHPVLSGYPYKQLALLSVQTSLKPIVEKCVPDMVLPAMFPDQVGKQNTETKQQDENQDNISQPWERFTPGPQPGKY